MNSEAKPDTGSAGSGDERRMLVVGASSGIGRALAVAAADSGWKVALAARRLELLEEASEEIGSGSAHCIRCDVTDTEQSAGLAGRAAHAMGGPLDAVVYTAGTAALGAFRDTDAEAWNTMLATNVVGAALVVSGALDHLGRPSASVGADRAARRPVVALLSSHSVADPFPGLVAYAASKSALDALARGLRTEEPWLRVVHAVVGDTATGFADSWDPAVARSAVERWLEEGYLNHQILSAKDVAGAILRAIEDEESPDELPVMGERFA